MKKLLIRLIGNYNWFRVTILIKTLFFTRQEKEENKKRQLFYSQFVSPNDLCFDVGANIGNRITPILNLGAKVVAIEPQKNCYGYLRYKFGEKIEIVTKGLGESESIKDFYISDETTISSFSESWIDSVKQSRFKNSEWNKVEKIEMTTLDILIEQYGVPVFIKIDVEGYELNVLKGLTKPVKMISFEYTVPEQIDKAIDCITQINKYNSNVEFNFSALENMTYSLPKWLLIEDMIKYINSNKFLETGFGDIYAQTKIK